MAANVPDKPRGCVMCVGGGPAYNEQFEKSTANGYEGLELRDVVSVVRVT